MREFPNPLKTPPQAPRAPPPQAPRALPAPPVPPAPARRAQHDVADKIFRAPRPPSYVEPRQSDTWGGAI